MQIQCTTNETEYECVMAELSDWLADLGISTHRMSFNNKDNIVQILIEHHQFNW